MNSSRRRSTMNKLAMLLGSLCCLSATSAHALKCDHRLVSLGESKTEVWSECGVPDTTDSRVIYRAVPVDAAPFYDPTHAPFYDAAHIVRAVTYLPVIIEVWTYNFGPQRFLQELSFEDGRLVEIRALERGY